MLGSEGSFCSGGEPSPAREKRQGCPPFLFVLPHQPQMVTGGVQKVLHEKRKNCQAKTSAVRVDLAHHLEQELAHHLPGVSKALRLAKHVCGRTDIPMTAAS